MHDEEVHPGLSGLGGEERNQHHRVPRHDDAQQHPQECKLFSLDILYLEYKQIFCWEIIFLKIFVYV